MDKSERNYFRITAKALSAINRPAILIGQFIGIQKNSSGKDMVVMKDIRPYLPNHGTSMICDHICLLDFPEELLYANYKDYYLMVCRPCLYKDKDMNIRGSFCLSNEFGQCIMRTNSKTKHSKDFRKLIVQKINDDKCINFLTFAEGRYAWIPGQCAWKDDHRINIEKENKAIKMKNKMKRRQARKMAIAEAKKAKNNPQINEVKKQIPRQLSNLERIKQKYGW